MNRFFKALVLSLLVLAIAVPAQAAWKDMWAKVYKYEGKMGADGKAVLTPITTGVTFKVMQRNATTAETLYKYKDDAFVRMMNPINATRFASSSWCDGKVQFRVDPGETGDRYVDLIVVDTNGGFTAVVEDFDEYTHSVIINEEKGREHVGIGFYDHQSETTGQDTGITLLASSFVRDVTVEPVTAVGAGSISVGTYGYARDMRVAVNTAIAAIATDKLAMVTNGANNTDYVDGLDTYGATLADIVIGSATTARGGGNLRGGVYLSSASSLLYSVTSTPNLAGTASGSAYRGHIYFFFTPMR